MKIAKLLLTITLTVFIILLNFRLYVFNINFYEEEFTKLNIPRETALETANTLFFYFKHNEPLTSDLFNEREKLHLIDVKNLISKTITFFYISLILLLILLYTNRKWLPKPLFYSGIFLMLIPALAYTQNFDNVFINFHLTFFNNELWILNPATDNLVNIFPRQFFLDFITKMLTNSFIVGILLILASYLIGKPKRILNIFKISRKKKIPSN